MENLEQIVAHNLTELRKEQKWTQAELAEKINYSDKSVSKWERGDALPDLKVLKQMADLFGVTLDYFVTENAAESKKQLSIPKSERVFRVAASLLAVCVVWLIAVSVFVSTSVYSKGIWMAFVWAVPVSMLVLSYCSHRWKLRVCALIFQSVFCWSLIASTYLQLLIYNHYNLWFLFLIGVPAQAVILLWALVKHNRV